MKKSKPKLRIKTRIYVPFLFILATLLITFAFPRQGRFKYKDQYQVNEPWRHDLLTAPITFSVEKSPQQYQADIDSALTFFTPYYKIIGADAKDDFRTDINLDPILKNLDHSYRIYISDKLDEIYDNGIISGAELKELEDAGNNSIMLSHNKEARPRELKSLNTAKDAYEIIINEAPSSFQKSKLRAVNLNKYLVENIVYDADKSESVRDGLIKGVKRTIGDEIKVGQRIIGEGEIINAEMYRVLKSLENKIEGNTGGANKSALIILGELLLIAILMGSFYMYLLFFRKKEARNREHVTFMVLVITLFVILTAIVVKFSLPSVYMIPYAIVTILIRTFIDSRTALNATLVTILMSSLMVPSQLEFIILQVTITMVCIFNLKELTERSQLIRSSFVILAAYTIVYIAFSLAQDGEISSINLGFCSCEYHLYHSYEWSS